MYFFVRGKKEITATVESGRLVVRQSAIQTLFCQPIDDHVITARSQQPRRTPPERTASLIFAASKGKVNSVGTHSSLPVLLVAVVLQVMQWMDAGLTPDCQCHAHDAVHGSGTVVTESSSCHCQSVTVSVALYYRFVVVGPSAFTLQSLAWNGKHNIIRHATWYGLSVSNTDFGIF